MKAPNTFGFGTRKHCGDFDGNCGHFFFLQNNTVQKIVQVRYLWRFFAFWQWELLSIQWLFLLGIKRVIPWHLIAILFPEVGRPTFWTHPKRTLLCITTSCMLEAETYETSPHSSLLVVNISGLNFLCFQRGQQVSCWGNLFRPQKPLWSIWKRIESAYWGPPKGLFVMRGLELLSSPCANTLYLFLLYIYCIYLLYISIIYIFVHIESTTIFAGDIELCQPPKNTPKLLEVLR